MGSVTLQGVGSIYAKLFSFNRKKDFILMAQNAYCIFPNCFWM